MNTNPRDKQFWKHFDAEKHAVLTRTKNQTRLVYFAVAYLSVSTSFFMVLLTAIALGKAHLPDTLVNLLAGATLGQFAGAPILLYKALFRIAEEKKTTKEISTR